MGSIITIVSVQAPFEASVMVACIDLNTTIVSVQGTLQRSVSLRIFHLNTTIVSVQASEGTSKVKFIDI